MNFIWIFFFLCTYRKFQIIGARLGSRSYCSSSTEGSANRRAGCRWWHDCDVLSSWQMFYYPEDVRHKPHQEKHIKFSLKSLKSTKNLSSKVIKYIHKCFNYTISQNQINPDGIEKGLSAFISASIW